MLHMRRPPALPLCLLLAHVVGWGYVGRPASAQRVEWDGPDRVDARVFGLRRSMDDLDDRIARRCELMFAAGVVDEARALLAAQPPLSPEASKVMGLQDLTALLAGEIDEAECKARIVQRTRRFARKQMTFFRGFDALTWIDVAPDDDTDTQAAKILAAL